MERKCKHLKTICAGCVLKKQNYCHVCSLPYLNNPWKIDTHRQSYLNKLLAYDVHVINKELRGKIIDAIEIDHSTNILPEFQVTVEKFVDSVVKVS